MTENGQVDSPINLGDKNLETNEDHRAVFHVAYHWLTEAEWHIYASVN